MTGPSILAPLASVGLYSSTVAEPAAGEIEWVSAGTYAVGDYRIRTSTHRVYRCVQAHTGRTTAPEADPLYWMDWAATERWAMFDDAVNTQSSASDSFTVVLRPGQFFNGFDVYGCNCASITYTYKDAPGGTVLTTATVDMADDPYDWYDWAFGPIRARSSLRVSDLVPYLGAELTVTFSNAGGLAKCGLMAIGDRRDLLNSALWGGVQYGASAGLVDATLYQKRSDGTVKAVLQPNTVDMDITLLMPRELADAAFAAIKDVLGVGVGWYATDIPGYDSLSGFGRASARIVYDSFGHASIPITVKGLP